MSEKTLYFTTTDPALAVEKGLKKVAIPAYTQSVEEFNKINGDFRADVSQIRNPGHHRKLFAILKIAVDNGILERMPRDAYNDLDREITAEKIDRIRVIYKDETEVLRYFLKWLFLPLEESLDADFNIVYQVSSIKFSRMDQIEFSDFYSKVIDYLAFKLKIKKEILEREGVNV